MKLKKLVGTLAVGALAATLAIGGTMAYLQSSDSDVNVMTVMLMSDFSCLFEKIFCKFRSSSIDERHPFFFGKSLFFLEFVN